MHELESTREVRRDMAGGKVREITGFFGHADDALFGATHLPVEAPRGGLVICSSVGPEQLSNYRNEVRLARRLALAGIAVQRFHYRGTGHSDGEDADLTLASMVTDASQAAARLLAMAGVRRPSYLGTRWGALVASRAASSAAGTLVLWEPVADPARAFREMFRAHASHELKIGTSGRRTTDTMLAELEASGEVDVLGYLLRRQFYASVIAASPADGLVPGQRILAVRLGRTIGADAGLGAFRERATAVGCSVEIVSLPQAPVWHFVDHSSGWGGVLVDETAQWLLAQLDGAATEGVR